MDRLPFEPLVDPPTSVSVAWMRRGNAFPFVSFVNGHRL